MNFFYDKSKTNQINCEKAKEKAKCNNSFN